MASHVSMAATLATRSPTGTLLVTGWPRRGHVSVTRRLLGAARVASGTADATYAARRARGRLRHGRSGVPRLPRGTRRPTAPRSGVGTGRGGAGRHLRQRPP